MKKKHTLFPIIAGIICVLLLAAASWYSVTYNDSRLVAPTDFSAYRFQVQDLPMIIGIVLFCLYILYLGVLLVRGILANRRRENEESMTRRISPKLGFLGFLGFAGFLGFFTYSVDQTVFPFLFFIFFGFFGFYYEGKMSDTFMDERFLENKMKAQLNADKIALAIIFLGAILFGQKRFMGNLDYTLILLLIVISLGLALNIFLGEYLLYRYDHEDAFDESGD